MREADIGSFGFSDSVRLPNKEKNMTEHRVEECAYESNADKQCFRSYGLRSSSWLDEKKHCKNRSGGNQITKPENIS